MPKIVRNKAVAAIVPTESVEQAHLAAWLNGRGVLWCHVPNGGRRAWKTAKVLKDHGVKSGVPDVLIFSPPRAGAVKDFVGVAIELKRQKGGALSVVQRQWLADLARNGWHACVCRGAKDAIVTLMGMGY